MLVEVPLRTHVALGSLDRPVYGARARVRNDAETESRKRRASASSGRTASMRTISAHAASSRPCSCRYPARGQIAARCVRVGRSRTLLKRRLLRGAPEIAGDPRSGPECVSIFGMDLSRLGEMVQRSLQPPLSFEEDAPEALAHLMRRDRWTALAQAPRWPRENPLSGRGPSPRSNGWSGAFRPVRSPMKRMRS